MNVREKEEVLIEVVIKGDPGMVPGTAACKVSNLCLPAFGHLKFEGALFP